MVQRGRKSADALSVIPLQINAIQRPDPPSELSPDAAQVWRDTVAAMRPDWFGRETWPMLTAYCCHVAIAQLLAKEIEAASPKHDLARYGKLLAMHARETAAISRLATRMRLTHQSSTNSRTLKRDPSAGLCKPWETIP